MNTHTHTNTDTDTHLRRVPQYDVFQDNLSLARPGPIVKPGPLPILADFLRLSHWRVEALLGGAVTNKRLKRGADAGEALQLARELSQVRSDSLCFPMVIFPQQPTDAGGYLQPERAHAS